MQLSKRCKGIHNANYLCHSCGARTAYCVSADIMRSVSPSSFVWKLLRSASYALMRSSMIMHAAFTSARVFSSAERSFSYVPPPLLSLIVSMSQSPVPHQLLSLQSAVLEGTVRQKAQT